MTDILFPRYVAFPSLYGFIDTSVQSWRISGLPSWCLFVNPWTLIMSLTAQVHGTRRIDIFEPFQDRPGAIPPPGWFPSGQYSKPIACGFGRRSCVGRHLADISRRLYAVATMLALGIVSFVKDERENDASTSGQGLRGVPEVIRDLNDAIRCSLPFPAALSRGCR